MRNYKALFVLGFLILTLMLSSCSSSRKGHKNQNRYHRERCGCSRFSELGSNEISTIDWVTYNDGQSGTK